MNIYNVCDGTTHVENERTIIIYIYKQNKKKEFIV
jgi:hypothetical protein